MVFIILMPVLGACQLHPVQKGQFSTLTPHFTFKTSNILLFLSFFFSQLLNVKRLHFGRKARLFSQIEMRHSFI